MGFLQIFVVQFVILGVYSLPPMPPATELPIETPETLQDKLPNEDTTTSSVNGSISSLCKSEEDIAASRFILHSEPKQWFDAMIACWEEGGQLAVPRSPKEARALGAHLFQPQGVAFFRADMGDALHVGIHDIAAEGTWRTLDGSLLSEAGYDLWLDGGEGQCGALLADGRYLRQPCNTSMIFACEAPNTRALRQASGYVEVGDAGRFRLYEEPLPWALALQRCEAEGATLAVPASAREAGLLAGVLFTRAAANVRLRQHGFFVGVTDVAREGEWRSVSGEGLAQTGYNTWASSLPRTRRQRNCGVLLKDGKYDDFNCLQPLPYCCQQNTSPRVSEDSIVVRGRYRLHKKPLPWFDALQACQRENATLVSVTSANEREFVKKLMATPMQPSIFGRNRGNPTIEIHKIHVAIYALQGGGSWKSIYEEVQISETSREAASYPRNEYSWDSLEEREREEREREEREREEREREERVESGEEGNNRYESSSYTGGLRVRNEVVGGTCVSMHYDGRYINERCSQQLPYLCKRR